MRRFHLLLPQICLLPFGAFAEVPKVVTDITPVHALVAQVMGDLGSPEVLLDPGADEHDFQLRPSQMASIQDADLLIWIGPELTPWFARASESSKATNVILLDAPGTQTQGYLDPHADHEEEGHQEGHAEKEHAEEGQVEEEHTEAGHAETDHDGHETENDGHAHSGVDPHAWLHPDNAANWLALIASHLAALDPANAEDYAANAAAAQADIAVLDAELAAALGPIAARPFVTYHNAYGYFVTRYALTFDGAIADGEAANPGAAHLSDLKQRLTDDAIVCVFPEAQHDPALASQLLEGTSARLGPVMDPVGSTLTAGPGAYAALMRGIAGSLTACLAP